MARPDKKERPRPPWYGCSFEAHLKGNAMQIDKVGLMTPGDMGQAVAMQIKAQGFTVCTALDHRSERSRALAREAGLTDVGTVARLVAE